MGNPKKFVKKRRFRGNQYTTNSRIDECADNEPRPSTSRSEEAVINVESVDMPSSRPTSRQDSASKRKIGGTPLTDDDWNDVGLNNIIINIGLVSQALASFCICKYCKKENTIDIVENMQLRRGLASNLSLFCKNCDKSFSFYTSPKVENYFDVNIRCVYGLRAIGKGMVAGRTLFGILNLPNPPQKFERYNQFLLKSLEEVATESMISATNEAIDCNVDEDGNTSNDLSVGLDGTWQKRGHTSLNGVVSVSCIDTGKILDVEVFAKYCHSCACKVDLNEHKCKQNYHGSSGGMEVEGALKMFARSEASRGVRYENYLGDGDCKGFDQVVASRPYGEMFKINKLECVGHVQKRIGGRLRKLRKEFKKKKLRDGKSIGGAKGRLTEEAINTLQNYYGLAIRRNKNDLQKMKKDVWATFFHKASTNEKPQHNLCDITWCSFKQAERDGLQYNHDNSLDEAVIEVIKPTYQALAHPDLLKKCLHGQTQNVNESYNSVLWSRIPKINFVGIDTLKFGTYDSIITYNEGNRGRVKVLQHVGLKPGPNCIKILSEIDILRVRKAEQSIREDVKKRRQYTRTLKKRKRDVEKQEEPQYEAGMF